jgi:hypothetical protein
VITKLLSKFEAITKVTIPIKEGTTGNKARVQDPHFEIKRLIEKLTSNDEYLGMLE